jgi:hypothetical protein
MIPVRFDDVLRCEKPVASGRDGPRLELRPPNYAVPTTPLHTLGVFV